MKAKNYGSGILPFIKAGNLGRFFLENANREITKKYFYEIGVFPNVVILVGRQPHHKILSGNKIGEVYFYLKDVN